MDESWRDDVECEWEVEGTIRFLVNDRDNSLSVLEYCMRHYLCLSCFIEARMIWRKKKKRSRIRTVQMDCLRGMLAIRRMDRMLKALITEMCNH